VIKPNRLAGLAALLLVGSVTPASAVTVTSSTSGVFGSSNSNVLSQGGVVITFNELISMNVDVAWSASALLGSFATTTAPSNSTGTLSDTFTLTITQRSPGPDGVMSTSTVSGTIFVENSQAFVMFNGPLTNGQEGTINDEIGIVSTPVPAADGDVGILHAPEPGTMAMACLALPLLGLGYARSRRRNS